MADRFPGDILLGGTIVIETIEQRERVENALSEFAEWCSHNYGESEIGDMPLDEVANNLNTEGYLHGKHDQARYGMFEEVEDACREAGIAYDRRSSAYGEWDGEYVRWRPGMDEPDIQIATESGDATIKVDEVERLINEVLYIKDETPYLDRIKNFEAAFKEVTGGGIPGLEPLKIIDNAPPSEE